MTAASETEHAELVLRSPAVPSDPRLLQWLAATALVADVTSIWAPFRALQIGLPLMSVLAWFLIGRASRRRDASVVRIDESGIRVETDHAQSAMPWSSVARVVDTGTQLVAVLRLGWNIPIVLGDVDVREVTRRMPSDVPYERPAVEPPPPDGMKASHKKLLLWLVLIGLMLVLYRMISQSWS